MSLGRSDLLTRFNELPNAVAREEMLRCCSSAAWAERMTSGRPYSSSHDAVRQSSAIVAGLTVTDLAEALAGHEAGQPEGRPEPAGQAVGAAGQPVAAVATGTQAEHALAASNAEYEARFGHVYLACQAGRSEEQLLAMLRARLANDARAEWQVIRSELQKINEIRLRKLLAG
jgi:2-oxo-4-hydroxy-4-carboxy-5-ureidoimidazoline decarboxylase